MYRKLYYKTKELEGVMHDLFVLGLTAYGLSVGFGMITFQKRGFQKVNRFWYKCITGIIRWTLNQLGDLLKYVGKSIPK